MDKGTLTSRRRFLCLTGSVAAGIAIPAIPHAVLAAEKKEGKEKGSDVNPVEDLMREHGILRRVLLIYEETIRRIRESAQLPSGVITDSAGIVRRFIEDYHEKLEEDEIFPRFEKSGKFVDVVSVLLLQHQAGRRITDSILKLSEPEKLKSAQVNQGELPAAVRQLYGSTPLFHWKADTKQGLSSAMQEFIHMYRPHADREDTVLFPAFRSIVSPKEFDELGDKFEDRENELFGKDGFGKMVQSVGEIEKKLGIYELSQFTPKT
jgi:hemerythrin-like domain-containing protein